MNFLGEFSRLLDAYLISRCLPTVVASPIYRGRPWASSQIMSGKGANNWPFWRGTSSTSYPDQRWSSAAKSTGDDAVLGSTVTSVLPLCWSWSRCTGMVTFARCLGLCLPPLHQRGNKDTAQAGARLVSIIMACVTGSSRGVPALISPPPREPTG